MPTAGLLPSANTPSYQANYGSSKSVSFEH
jgi:hypothetical protein